MADGLAAAELATVLLDLSPEPPELDRDSDWEPRLELPVWRAAIGDLVRLGELWGRVAAWSGQSVLHPIRRANEIRTVGGAIRTLVTTRIIAPKSSLNTTITAARSVHFIRLSFEEMREIAHASGSTINDVLLTIVAGGLHDLLDGRGELTEKSELQALVPVGRVNENGRGLANAVSALFVRLPVGVNDPLAALRSVSAEVSNDKNHHQELAASTFLGLLEPLPQRVLAAMVGVVQHQPFFNLIVTNVPGPPVPLYALGAKLLEAFPIVPLAGNQSLGVAALSYEGQLNLGVFSNPTTCPDVEVFCAGVEASLKSLAAPPGPQPRPDRVPPSERDQSMVLPETRSPQQGGPATRPVKERRP
jgi:WS/DGAT/MGAT family acyltransferase